jgi:hypothetical protein
MMHGKEESLYTSNVERRKTKKKEVQAVNRPASEQREREGKKQRITAR